MTDISELLHDPDFETEFILNVPESYRHEDGRWIESIKSHKKHGVVQPASTKETQYLTQGDEHRNVINVWSDDYIGAASNQCPSLGDIIEWHCSKYRVVAVKDWSQYGYWKASAIELIRGKEDG